MFRSLVVVILFIFFFFKQKTAYEMRISDWSSDVCSSDLDEEDCAGGLARDLLRLRRDEPADDRVAAPPARNARAAGRAPARLADDDRGLADGHEIGRASCRERVCQYV